MNWFLKLFCRKSKPTSLTRPGEQPLLVFVSSVMDSELQWAREATVKTLDRAPYFQRWAFEYTPASSSAADDTYLAKVRESDIVIWLVGSTTTEPVRKEIQEALDNSRRLWVFKLPASSRSPETEALIKKIGLDVKWVSVPNPELLPELIDQTRGDEFVRAMRKKPGMGRAAHLEELSRASRARCIERWQAVGLARAEACALADDRELGDPATTLGSPIKEPICVITGDFGSGKSLVAERLLQKAIDAATKTPDSPVPIFLRARDVLGHLQEKAEQSSSGIGNPKLQGANIVVDGADEVGVDAAAELLAEARLLANTWPKTSIIITTRPMGVPITEDELLRIAPLSEDAAEALIERIIGRELSLGEKSDWPDSIRSALERPLFVVLMASHLRKPRDHSPKTLAELINWMVERALGPQKLLGKSVDEALQKLAVLTTTRKNSPIPVAEVGAPDLISSLLDSRLVVADDGLISFPLPVLAQWFAAKALLSGGVSIDSIVADRKSLEIWYYPMVIAVGMASHDQATSIMRPLTKASPAIASMVSEEALARWGMANDVKPPPAQESGRRIREAMKAWTDGIGPLAKLISPLRSDGSLPPLGVAINDAWLEASWYQGTENLGEVTDLPPAARPLGPGAPGWHSVRAARPGRQPSWAWRWTLEELRNKLSQHVDKHALPISEGPIHREKMWDRALLLDGKGSLHYQPIPISKIEQRLEQLSVHGPRLNYNGHNLDLSEIRHEIERLKAAGKAAFEPVWPSPDGQGGRWIWSGYSEKQVLARVTAVFEGALQGYGQLVEKWFPSLAPRMELAALLPARVVGFVAIDHEEPHATWHLEPLPRNATSRAEFKLTPAGKNPAILHGETLQGLLQKVHTLRPEIAEWYSYSYHNSCLEVFHLNAATEMAYRWLKDDLRRLHWMS